MGTTKNGVRISPPPGFSEAHRRRDGSRYAVYIVMDDNGNVAAFSTPEKAFEGLLSAAAGGGPPGVGEADGPLTDVDGEEIIGWNGATGVVVYFESERIGTLLSCSVDQDDWVTIPEPQQR